MPAAADEVTDAKSPGLVPFIGRIVVHVDAEMHDVVGVAPGFAFEHGGGHDVSPHQIDVGVQHLLHALGIDAGILLLETALEAVVQHQESGLGTGPEIEQVGRVVRDDTVVACRGCERLGQGDQACMGRHGPHPLVPSFVVLAREVHDDVEPVAEHAELVDPWFVAIEYEQLSRRPHLAFYLYVISRFFIMSSRFHRSSRSAPTPSRSCRAGDADCPYRPDRVRIIGHRTRIP